MQNKPGQEGVKWHDIKLSPEGIAGNETKTGLGGYREETESSNEATGDETKPCQEGVTEDETKQCQEGDIGHEIIPCHKGVRGTRPNLTYK